MKMTTSLFDSIVTGRTPIHITLSTDMDNDTPTPTPPSTAPTSVSSDSRSHSPIEDPSSSFASSSSSIFPSRVKQIFFDCDNTLINTEEISFEAASTIINKVLADQSIAIQYTNEELLNHFFSFTARQMIIELQKIHSFTLSPSQIAAYTQLEEDIVVGLLLARPQPCPGIESVLAQMPNSYKLAVVSSSPIKRIRAALIAGEIAKYFDDQVFSAKSSMPVPKSKPDPAIYQWAMEKNGVVSGECVAFEDSRSGARSSIAAGIVTVGYVGAYSSQIQREQVAKTLMEEGCVMVMEDYSQFFECLELVEELMR